MLLSRLELKTTSFSNITAFEAVFMSHYKSENVTHRMKVDISEDAYRSSLEEEIDMVVISE